MDDPFQYWFLNVFGPQILFSMIGIGAVALLMFGWRWYRTKALPEDKRQEARATSRNRLALMFCVLSLLAFSRTWSEDNFDKWTERTYDQITARMMPQCRSTCMEQFKDRTYCEMRCNCAQTAMGESSLKGRIVSAMKVSQNAMRDAMIAELPPLSDACDVEVRQQLGPKAPPRL